MGRLQVFQEVARAGTFAAAAHALDFTPSAVSQQMARLEAEVGAALLVRTPRGVRLTQAGEVLLQRAARILSEVAGARRDLDALAGHGAGQLDFGCAIGALLHELVGPFRARHPDLELRLVVDKTHVLAPLLREGELDLALLFEADRPVGMDHRRRLHASDEDVVLEELFDDPFVLVVGEDHPLATRPEVHLEDLAGELLVGSRSAHGMADLVTACQDRGFEPEFCEHWAMDYGVMRSFVAMGEGIAVVPGRSAVDEPPGLVRRAFDSGAPSRRVLLARPADRVMSRAAQAMEALVREVAAAQALRGAFTP